MRSALGLVVRLFGLANLLYAALGLYLVFRTLKGYLRYVGPKLENPPHFPAVFFTLTGVSCLFLILLVYSGIRLLQFRPSAIRFSCLVFLCETLWFFPVQTIMEMIDSPVSESVGAAGGVGNMGISPQILTGYPLVGLIALVLIRWRLGRTSPPAAIPTPHLGT
jgi:hypothetical protein